MYRALYRTWRPQTFDDVCGQKQITDILKYQVSEGKISHAYLFCGSRGTGKTTCAKILAKAVNCLHPQNGNPCNRCEACRAIDAGAATDVIEMDAASNNGVDNVRDLKEEIVFMPAELKYRVYIIDEVHMMSPSAFNALLKTLEEPPSYVLFILATTELSKLPSTIISRCQRCDFRRIATGVIMGRLEQIAAAEGMTLTEDGARMIARAAQGGMRDAVSLLELCGGAHAPIDEELVTHVLGAGDRSVLYRTAEAIADKEYDVLYAVVDEIVMASSDLAGFWSGLGDVARDMIVYKTAPNAKEYLDLTDSEYERIAALSEKLPMARLFYISRLISDTLPALQKTGVARRAAVEIALTRMCDPRLAATPEAMLARLEELEREVKLLRVGGAPMPAAQAEDRNETDGEKARKTAERPAANPPAQSAPAPAPGQSAAPEPRKAEQPAQQEKAASRQSPVAEREEGTAVPGWRGIANEFNELYPGYALLFDGSAAVLRGEVLVLKMRDSFLLGNLEKDQRALRAIIGLVSDRMNGVAIRSAEIQKIPVGGANNRGGDTFF